MEIAIGVLIAVGIVAAGILSSMKKSKDEGTRLGTAGFKTKIMWDGANTEQRSLLSAAISITEGTYRDTLLGREWEGLPATVQVSLGRAIRDIDDAKRFSQ